MFYRTISVWYSENIFLTILPPNCLLLRNSMLEYRIGTFKIAILIALLYSYRLQRNVSIIDVDVALWLHNLDILALIALSPAIISEWKKSS